MLFHILLLYIKNNLKICIYIQHIYIFQFNVTFYVGKADENGKTENVCSMLVEMKKYKEEKDFPLV